MKKLVLSSLFVVGLSAGALAQGTIFVDNLNNTGVFNGLGGVAFNPANNTGNPVYDRGVTQNGLIFTLDTRNTWGAMGGPAGNQLLGTDVSFQIFGGPTADSATSLVESVTGAAIAGDNIEWGQFLDGQGSKTVPGTTASSPVFLDIFFWEGSSFSTYAAAVFSGEAYVGVSGVFQNNAGGGANSPPALTGMPDVLIGGIPEPSSFALAILGAGTFLLYRRRLSFKR